MDRYKYQSTRNAMEAVSNFQHIRHKLTKAMEEDARTFKEAEQAKRREAYAQEYNDSKEKVNKAIQALEEDIADRRMARIDSALSVGNAEKEFQLLSLPVTLSADDLRVIINRHPENNLLRKAVAEYARQHEYTSDKDLFRLDFENVHAENPAGKELCGWLRKTTEDHGHAATAANLGVTLTAEKCARRASAQSNLFYSMHEKGILAQMEAET